MGANGQDGGFAPAACADGANSATRGADGAALPACELMLERLLAAHEAWFDITRDFHLAGRSFPGFAAFHSHGEQYVLSKRAKLWEVDTHEYIFFDIVEHLEEAIFRDYIDFMTTEAIGMVEPHPNHMSSNISLVIIAGSADPVASALVRRTRFRKNFMLGLQGWSDLRVAVVDMAESRDKRILTNAAGKTLRPTIEANLDLRPE